MTLIPDENINRGRALTIKRRCSIKKTEPNHLD